MKAIIVREPGPPDQLTLDDVPSPDVGPQQVLIEAHYAGVNFPDTLIIEGKYQFQPELPFSPGGEVAGVIKKVGSAVKNVTVGDRVVSGCSWGGYAEEVVSFGTNTFRLPDNVPFDQASVFLQTYATTYHALIDRGQAREGENLLVLGAAGGTGTAAIQIAKLLGLNVIASASSEVKQKYCLQQGANAVIDTFPDTFRNKIKEVTHEEGLDLVYDPVGNPLSELAFRSLRFGGRHLVIGFAAGQMPQLPWNLPLLKCASITGVFWGRFFREYPDQNARNVEQLLTWLSEQKLQPQIHKVLPLAEAPQALKMISKKEVLGKVALKIR